jgi:radical SAM superfamily enzyme YgiQ (UPF0313 family)
MRISFIEARSPGLHIYSKFPIPRLGAVLLSTILKEEGHDTRVYLEDTADPDWSAIGRSDVLCISTITSTAPRAYELALRAKKTGMPVIMGGAHPSFMPEEALRYADYVVRQEGDESLPKLIRHLETGSPALQDIGGISYKIGSTVRNNPPRPYITNLDALPMPDFSLVHGWKPTSIYPVSTSRGCPFDCRFCSVIKMFGRGYRFRSVETTMADLRSLSGMKTSIFFVDDNFTSNKARSKEMMRAMIAEKIKLTWSAQVRTDVAKDKELLKLMVDSGCTTIYVGFESINPKTLEVYNKKQDLESIKNCIHEVKAHGIDVHGMFVLGADTDDIGTIKSTGSFAARAGIDTVQFMMLTPLPGTPVFDDLLKAGRLLHTKWQKYDAHHVVFRPALMRPEALHVETLKAMGRFYSWGYILRSLNKLDLYHAAVGLYGKNAIRKALKEARSYLAEIMPGEPVQAII